MFISDKRWYHLNMKKLIKSFFGKWHRPVVFLGIGFFLLFIAVSMQKASFADFSILVIAVAFLLLLLSIINQITKRNKLEILLSIVSFAIGCVLFFFSSIFLFFFYQSTDGYADNLEIPNTITIEKPIDKQDTLTNKERLNTDFQIYNSFQPGLFEYDVWLTKIDSGVVYLKAYEITGNDPLSKDRLPLRSSLRVGNTTDSLMKFSTKNHFTIYEGDWDKPYGARFEIWYKPDNGNETKLKEKNYIIEGWQR